MTKQLLSMEGRLEGATQRVQLLATLLEQKEVQLRNSEAALLAERRLFWLRQQHLPQQSGDGDGGAGESKRCGGGPSEQCESRSEGFLSDLRVTPEVGADVQLHQNPICE
jgi:type II secretory pathway component PulK